MKGLVYMKKMVKFMMLSAAIIVALSVTRPFTAYAAGEPAINISEDIMRLDVGKTGVCIVDYRGLAQGFSDMAVVSSDSGIAAAALADLGNGQAHLAIAGNGIGTATVAVYSISNAAIVDYVAVQSGLADVGKIINKTDGKTLTAIYNDKLINYSSILLGRNGAQLAVTGLVLEREKGLDCLKISGELLANDAKLPGMTVFYADFYDAAGGLIKRQAVYTRDPQANTHLELKWYVPEGCVRVEAVG